jgi:uncharacterized protein with von Willebrand factor type A (vWA) domain
VLDVLAGFVRELRAAGLPVSLTENLDALEAVRHVPLDDREAFKWALGATLVKSHDHWEPFEAVFDLYFSLRPPGPDGNEAAAWSWEDDGASGGARAGDAPTPDELVELLYQALRDADEAAAKALVRQAVARFSGMEAGRPVGGSYYRYRTLRNMDLDGILERLLRTAQHEADGPLTALEERLARDEYAARLDGLRREVDLEVRRRLVAERGSAAMAKTLRRPLPEQVDFMHATGDELAEIGRAHV